jgi:peptide deformylase
MAVRKVITIADERLYQPSENVEQFDNKLRDLVRDMFDTMYEEHGVGLAAVQIGIMQKVIVIDLENAGFVKAALINPEVVETSDDTDFNEEGCLSVPGVTANLSRPKWVKVAYQDVFGSPKELEGADLLARALLHEIDHTNGKVFIDQLNSDERKKVEIDIKDVKEGRLPKHYHKPPYRK